MHYDVQFLDGAGNVFSRWYSVAPNLAGVIALIEAAHWPAGAVRLRILDADGRVVHERLRADGR